MDIKNICIYNMYPAILGIRNSFKSKDKSDSQRVLCFSREDFYSFNHCKLGKIDEILVNKLLKKGKKDPEYCNQERKFLRQILVSMDISGSIKFWAQMDTFKIATVRNSESTMHSITKGILEQSDFEREINEGHLDYVQTLIIKYNLIKKMDEIEIKKWSNISEANCNYKGSNKQEILTELFELIDANLPSGYVLESHWTGNYENLRNIYHGRKNHKMFWWHEFISLVEKLPYFELLIKGEDIKKELK